MKKRIEKLSLHEKALLLQGKSVWTTWPVERLNIPSIFLADGPHGLRKQAGSSDHLGLKESLPATCFPTAATMANSWDVSLGEALGSALGTEAAANDVHVLLGPGLNMKRTPLCGRNFEYFSEDPYLAGKMAAAYIRGIQAKGPAACPKHFAVNSQETRRMAVDAVVDERTLREIYLTGFEIAVKEGGAKAVMSSYNQVGGVYANENAHLLEDILRQEWGFDGFVVTDWGADNDHVEGVRNGSNLVMPAPGMGEAMELVQAVQAGKLPEELLDQRLIQLLQVVEQTHEKVADMPKTYDQAAHHALARRCARESIVLLENDGILPLRPDAAVTLIGEFAVAPRYQGAGSSKVNPTRVDTLLDCAGMAGLQVEGFAAGYGRKGALQEAVALAKKASTVLLCVGLDEAAEAEGADRQHLCLAKEQQMLIQQVCAVNPNVVLVLSGGAPFQIPDCTYRAAIHGYLGGQAGAGAMIDVLTGKACPSGKLAETWPVRLEDIPTVNYHSDGKRTCEYREGPFIGYRYYDTAKVPVRYCFGHGLSYTCFIYSDLSVTENEVVFTLKNDGERAGAEIVQLYVACPDSKLPRPCKELKGFAKVYLEAGESRQVRIALDDKVFRYFDTDTGTWETEAAEHRILIGASVQDIRLSATLPVCGRTVQKKELPSYMSGHIQSVSDGEFTKLLGRPIPDGSWSGPLRIEDTFAQLSYAKSGAARLLHRILKAQKEKAERQGKTNINILFVYNMPFRAMYKMVGNWISRQMVEDFVLMVNGRFFTGLGKMIADFFRNRRQTKAFMRKLR